MCACMRREQLVLLLLLPIPAPFATFKVSGIAFTWVMLHMLKLVVVVVFSSTHSLIGACFKHNKFLIWMWPIVSGKSSFLIWDTKSHKFQWRHGLAITNHTHTHMNTHRIHSYHVQTMPKSYVLTQPNVDKVNRICQLLCAHVLYVWLLLYMYVMYLRLYAHTLTHKRNILEFKHGTCELT